MLIIVITFFLHFVLH